MSHAPASPSAPFDRKQGGLLLANMLSAWLDGEPSGEATVEAVYEPQDRGTSPQPIRLCLPAPVGNADGGTGGFQDVSGRCLDGTSGRCVGLGSLPTIALGLGLASAAGAVCPHSNPGDRRGWLLRSGRFQRRTSVGVEGDHGQGRATFFAHAPPG